eukprot:jgi/Mesvir1/5261/Mv15376-RA.4
MKSSSNSVHNRITWFGTIALLVNNVVGPGLAAIPRVFQAAGWVPSITVMLFMTVLSYLSSLFLCETMLRIPGNKNYRKELEFLAIAKHYLSHAQYKITMLLFVISLECLNMAAIVQSIQVTDDLLEKLFGASCGLQLWPQWDALCSRDLDALDDAIILSAGLVIFALITVPIGFLQLDDSIAVQQGSFVILLLIIVQWMFDFLDHEVHFDAVPAFAGDQHQVLGVIAFNYCFVTTIPSWVNRKKRGVDEDSSVMGSVMLSSSMFLLVGLWGGLTLVLSDNTDLLDVLSKEPSLLSALAVYLFPVVVNLAGIPVLSIIVRDNLVQEGIFSHRWASIISNLFPWLCTLPFYTGQGFQNLINWTGLLTLGVVNFVIPLAMFIKAMERDPVLDEGAFDTAAPGTLGHRPPELSALLTSGSDSESSGSGSWESHESSSEDEPDNDKGHQPLPGLGQPTREVAGASRKMGTGGEPAAAGTKIPGSDADTMGGGDASFNGACGKEAPAPAGGTARSASGTSVARQSFEGGPKADAGGTPVGGSGAGGSSVGTNVITSPSGSDVPETRDGAGVVALTVSAGDDNNSGSKGAGAGAGVRAGAGAGGGAGRPSAGNNVDENEKKKKKRRKKGGHRRNLSAEGHSAAVVRQRSGRQTALPAWMAPEQWTWIARHLMWIFIAMLLFYIPLNLYFVTMGEPFFMRFFKPGGAHPAGSAPGWMDQGVGATSAGTTQVLIN